MEQFAREITALVRKPSEFREVEVSKVDEIWGMDLADMSEVTEHNDTYRYILVVMDVFSRYAWCFPLKNKVSANVWEIIEPLIEKYKPKHLWADRGGEFYSNFWKLKLKQKGITLYSTYSPHKVSIVERFIRTLKERLWFHFLSTGKRKWVDVLDAVVKDYNTTIHRTLKVSPTEAREKGKTKIKPKQLELGKPIFKIGDWVRISRTKDTFEKGFHPKWSFEMFRINGIRKLQPPTYYLEDYYGESIEGSFYENELQKVHDPSFFPIEKVLETKTVKGKKKSLVKLLGYDKPTWMEGNQLENIE